MFSYQKVIIQTQNSIVNKLAEQNVKLLSNYINIDTPLDIVCKYGHETQIVWRKAKNYTKRLMCIGCIDLKNQANNAIEHTRHMTDDELITLGNQYGFTYIDRINQDGYYRWQCNNGHITEKKIHHIKSRHCTLCEDEHKEQLMAGLTEQEITHKRQAAIRKSELQKERTNSVREQRTIQ